MEGLRMTKKELNRERQRRFRERQRQLGRRTLSLLVTDDEAFYLERVLLSMRKDGLTPAMGRDSKGRMKPIDI